MAAAAQGREAEALAKASEAAEARAQAEEAHHKAAEARQAAEERAEWFESEAKLAQLEARDAKDEAERLRRQRARELDRLQGALAEIAETRRSALGVVMNLGDSIEFDFDRAELRPQARELLSRIAGVLMTADGFQIQVFGHTDDVGDADYNVSLSERRAEAVRSYLVDAGINPAIISMRGYGKSQPLVVGSTADARARNRRVEIAVTHSEGEMVSIAPSQAGG